MPALLLSAGIGLEDYMGLGTKNVRNWGIEQQKIALSLELNRKRLAYKVIKNALFIAPSACGLTLPFNESIADLRHIRRGRWESLHPIDGRRLATGCSLCDIVGKTIGTLQ